MVKRLADDQLAAFDTDYIRDHVGWDRMEKVIAGHFPSGEFSFLDIGGGNGAFADRLLTVFPNARGTVLDNARYLLDKNTQHGRKTLVECSVEDMGEHLDGRKFDFISFNWVLHHFVEDSYNASIKVISSALMGGKQLLSENGVISILENCYISCSSESLPSKIIFHSVSSKTLAAVTRRLGANTSGIGVCYLSEKLWCSMIEDLGLRVLRSERTGSHRTSQLKRLLCHIKGVDVVHIVARK